MGRAPASANVPCPGRLLYRLQRRTTTPWLRVAVLTAQRNGHRLGLQRRWQGVREGPGEPVPVPSEGPVVSRYPAGAGSLTSTWGTRPSAGLPRKQKPGPRVCRCPSLDIPAWHFSLTSVSHSTGGGSGQQAVRLSVHIQHIALGLVQIFKEVLRAAYIHGRARRTDGQVCSRETRLADGPLQP